MIKQSSVSSGQLAENYNYKREQFFYLLFLSFKTFNLLPNPFFLALHVF
jgi:hypothetical protein